MTMEEAVDGGGQGRGVERVPASTCDDQIVALDHDDADDNGDAAAMNKAASDQTSAEVQSSSAARTILIRPFKP